MGTSLMVYVRNTYCREKWKRERADKAVRKVETEENRKGRGRWEEEVRSHVTRRSVSKEGE
jgi:hypothetical protein